MDKQRQEGTRQQRAEEPIDMKEVAAFADDASSAAGHASKTAAELATLFEAIRLAAMKPILVAQLCDLGQRLADDLYAVMEDTSVRYRLERDRYGSLEI